MVDESQKWIKEKSEALYIKPEVYLKILRSAVQSCSDELDAFQAVIEQDDYQAVHLIAHKFKGVFANLRISEVADSARMIDDLAKSNQPRPQLMESFQEFKEHFAQLQQRLA